MSYNQKTSNVPLLRFGDFKDSWNKQKLNDFAVINPEGKELPEQFIYIDLGCVISGELLFENTIFRSDAPSRAQRLLKSGDVLFQMVRPYQKNNYYFNKIGNYVASTGYAQIRTDQNSKYLYQYIHFQKFVDCVIERCTGTSYPAINSTDLSNIPISFPSLPEQQKIASFLSTVDEKLQALKKKKTLLEQYKKGVMQKIFSQEIRFRDDNGKEFPEWENRHLFEVLKEHCEKSKGSEEVFSVSVHKGVINQIEHLGRSFAAKSTSHYNLVKPNDIIYTKSPTGDFPYGIIKQSKIKENVIVSPLYGVFTPETEHLGYILDVYFESANNVYNYLASIIQKGAKNTINITNEKFLSKSLFLPISFDEQAKIASFIKSINDKINHCQTQIEKTEMWKKGLLQRMFC